MKKKQFSCFSPFLTNVLRTNLPKEIMAFPGIPFDQNLPSFIHHTEMLSYLQKYATHYGLEEYISFQTVVERVLPVEQSKCANGGSEGSSTVCFDGIKWKVDSRHLPSDSTRTDCFDAVVVCNG